MYAVSLFSPRNCEGRGNGTGGFLLGEAGGGLSLPLQGHSGDHEIDQVSNPGTAPKGDVPVRKQCFWSTKNTASLPEQTH